MTLVAIERPRLVVARRRVIALATRGMPGRAGRDAGFAPVHHLASAIVAAATLNFVDADDVVMTLPSGAPEGTPIRFIVRKARSGFQLDCVDATIDEQAGPRGFPTPCTIEVVKGAADGQGDAADWIIFNLFTPYRS